MHSASSRFNTITITTGLTLAVMCLINYLHGWYIYNQNLPLLTNNSDKIKFQIIQIPNFMKTASWEQLGFRYNLDADLSSLYNWNLKQIYVYIQVQWYHDKSKQPKNGTSFVEDPNLSRAIVADWILQTPPNDRDQQKIKKAYKISVENKPLEYSVRDVHNNLKGNTLKVFLRLEYMPFVGSFFKSTLYQTQLKIPSDYISRR